MDSMATPRFVQGPARARRCATPGACAVRPDAEHCGTMGAKNRYAMLHRIQTAVKPGTRARRIAQYVGMLERGETVH
jgi:hypothetical protein